jgi:hypothetical protein
VGLLQTSRVLDPLERASEIVFGLIMVLTFTGSISVAEDGRAEMRTVLMGAIGCNLAWGLVDAATYFMANLMTRARNLATYRAVRLAGEPEEAHRLIRDALPPLVSMALTPSDIESLHQRLRRQSEPSEEPWFTRASVTGAAGVFLLVFSSTFPVIIPFLVMRDTMSALRMSDAIAAALLFAAGWSVGKHSGLSGWRTGSATLLAGVVLVAITMALGGWLESGGKTGARLGVVVRSKLPLMSSFVAIAFAEAIVF